MVGSAINFGPEWQRYRWKTDARRIGRLYTGLLFRYARHVNYTGEFVSFVGLALLTGCWWTLWVPGCMGAGLATFSIWEIEFYLAGARRRVARLHGECPWLLVPGLY